MVITKLAMGFIGFLCSFYIQWAGLRSEAVLHGTCNSGNLITDHRLSIA